VCPLREFEAEAGEARYEVTWLQSLSLKSMVEKGRKEVEIKE